MIAQAVIGALYGDEGKGLTVDYLADAAMRDHGSCVVVRSNGGAQAAHTVQLSDGTRHVFHHFGSGTLAGASTHLSRFMVLNPIVFNQEWDELEAKGHTPSAVSVSPNCLVTFPQDMLLNQMFEIMRGGARHGSCGLGIGETMERAEVYGHSFTVRQFLTAGGHWPSIRSQFKRILDRRLENLDIKFDDLPEELREYLHDSNVFNNFVTQFDLMLSRCTLLDDNSDFTKPVVFEAAQGLALDRDMGWFPYVTRSKTGLFNVVKLARDMGIEQIETIYAMRTYTTRHGAGPLDGEDSYIGGFSINDPTNKPNDWQGTLRFAPLDLWLAKRLVDLDIAAARSKIKVERKVMLTCLDQAPEMVPYFGIDRNRWSIARDSLARVAMTAVDATGGWTSSGPTRDTIANA